MYIFLFRISQENAGSLQGREFILGKGHYEAFEIQNNREPTKERVINGFAEWGVCRICDDQLDLHHGCLCHYTSK